MSVSLPINAFITQATAKQLEKKAGGVPTVWTEKELEDLRVIAHDVAIGNFSRLQALKSYAEARKSGKTLGNIRPNKSPTAFKLKLSKLVREIKRANAEKIIDEKV